MEYAVKYGALRKMYEFLEKGNGGYVTILTSLCIDNRQIVVQFGSILVTFYRVTFMTFWPFDNTRKHLKCLLFSYYF